MTFPDDFAAEWRAKLRADRARAALCSDFLTYLLRRQRERELIAVLRTAVVEASASYRELAAAAGELSEVLAETNRVTRLYCIAAHAERLSAWGPWR